MEKLSQSLENYLKTIIYLGGTPNQSIQSSHIARHLGVSKTSVGKAISALRTRGFVVQPYYGEVTLSEKGFLYGAAIVKRQLFLKAFLEKGVGIQSDTAEKEACAMEYAMSNDSFEKWVVFIEGLNIFDNEPC